MKVATWNINECIGITCDLDNQRTANGININNINEIVEKINEYDFDIVCFQEYPTYINESISLTKELLSKTKLKYCETYDTFNTYLFSGGRAGIAVFSKYEIIKSYRTLFNNPNLIKKGSNGNIYYSFDRGIIKIKLKVEDTDYTIITGHAIAFSPFDKSELDYPESYKPLENLINDCIEDNLIVLGDFNSEKLFKLIPSVKDKISDIVNMPTTKEYYEKRGKVQMDYILLNNKMKSNNVDILDNFSDHYIVEADIFKK